MHKHIFSTHGFKHRNYDTRVTVSKTHHLPRKNPRSTLGFIRQSVSKRSAPENGNVVNRGLRPLQKCLRDCYEKKKIQTKQL